MIFNTIVKVAVWFQILWSVD